MATQLQIYNDAAILLGQTKLASLTEDRELRYQLDDVYNLGAADYCLQLVKPRTSTTTVKLNTPTTSAEHDLDSVHTLPADFIELVGVYSDSKLDQPISRYIIDGNTLACEFGTIYLRYTSNSFAISTWSPVFVRVVSAYLASEVAANVAPDDYERLVGLFQKRAEMAAKLEGEQEPVKRSAKPTNTLTNTWRQIYNDALLILGLDQITSNDDDSNRRSKLDVTLDTGLVRNLMEDNAWNFGLKTQKMDYDPSLEPVWGYNYVFAKPSDLYRLEGVYLDEYLQYPLKDYHEEGDYWYSSYQTFYVEYVSSDYLTTPDLWPSFFRRLVAARMAKDAAMSLRAEGADVQFAEMEWEKRESDAENNDAMISRPRKIAQGSWTKAMLNGQGPYRGRP